MMFGCVSDDISAIDDEFDDENVSCGAYDLDLCETEDDCLDVGGYYYDGYCHNTSNEIDEDIDLENDYLSYDDMFAAIGKTSVAKCNEAELVRRDTVKEVGYTFGGEFVSKYVQASMTCLVKFAEDVDIYDTRTLYNICIEDVGSVNPDGLGNLSACSAMLVPKGDTTTITTTSGHTVTKGVDLVADSRVYTFLSSSNRFKVVVTSWNTGIKMNEEIVMTDDMLDEIVKDIDLSFTD